MAVARTPGVIEDGRHTEGVCEDGAAILCDGVMMTIPEILAKLDSAEGMRALLEQWLETERLVAKMLQTLGKP